MKPIPVSKYLPMVDIGQYKTLESDWVLAWDGWGWLVAKFGQGYSRCDQGFYWWYDEEHKLSGITHWMPLPPSPEG